MNVDEFKANYYLFDPSEYGVIYSFVDFGNVRPWAAEKLAPFLRYENTPPVKAGE